MQVRHATCAQAHTRYVFVLAQTSLDGSPSI